MSSFPSDSRIRFWSFSVCLALILLSSPHVSFAQSIMSENAVVLTHWPSEKERVDLQYEILPFIDWMRLGYAAGEEGGRPVLRLDLEWKAEGEAIYKQKRTSLQDVPGNVRLVAVDLRADVYVGGERTAELAVVVDSMLSGPSPDRLEIGLPHLDWDNVFSDTPAERARWIFREGFELRNLEIASAAFAVIGEATADGEVREAARPRRHGMSGPVPTTVSVYRGARAVDVILDVYWLIGPRPYRWTRNDGERRTAIGRATGESRSRTGRRSTGRRSSAENDAAADDDSEDSATGIGRDRDGKRKAGGIRLPEGLTKDDDDDDDDDDDSKLVPYAIAAVAAAGILAAAGGTLGYYGSSRHAPYGLTSGIVRRDGGLLLQAGVNEALIFNESQPKKLVVKLLAFGNLLRSTVQPALGAGVLATSEAGEIKYEPSVSLGAVGRYRMFLFYGGYDFWQQGAEFGAAFNFRELFKRTDGSPQP